MDAIARMVAGALPAVITRPAAMTAVRKAMVATARTLHQTKV
jgi:hypothetical protein